MSKISKISKKTVAAENIFELVREDGSKELRFGRTASKAAKSATNKIKKSVEDCLEYQASRLVLWHQKLGVTLTQLEAETLLIEKRKQLRTSLSEAVMAARKDANHDLKELKKLIRKTKEAKSFITIAEMVMDQRFEAVIAEMETPQQVARRVLS